jgi:lipoprotein NlpD
MSDSSKFKQFWTRLRNKYRISIINEGTWAEHGHIHLSAWRVIVLLSIVVIITTVLSFLVILYTPIRNFLPGYSENIRHQLMEESARVDSLGTSLELQRQYLNIITQVVAGEVSSDTVQSLDSMQLIMREELLEAKSQATADFMAQHEAKERDNLQLFEAVQSPHTSHLSEFFAPIHGAITQAYTPSSNGIKISSYGNKNVSSTLDGTILHIQYDLNKSYTIIVQHLQFISKYTGLEQTVKQVGQTVKAGEVIGLLKDQQLGFELWKNGQSVNPEEFIVF